MTVVKITSFNASCNEAAILQPNFEVTSLSPLINNFLVVPIASPSEPIQVSPIVPSTHQSPANTNSPTHKPLNNPLRHHPNMPKAISFISNAQHLHQPSK